MDAALEIYSPERGMVNTLEEMTAVEASYYANLDNVTEDLTSFVFHRSGETSMTASGRSTPRGSLSPSRMRVQQLPAVAVEEAFESVEATTQDTFVKLRELGLRYHSPARGERRERVISRSQERYASEPRSDERMQLPLSRPEMKMAKSGTQYDSRLDEDRYPIKHDDSSHLSHRGRSLSPPSRVSFAVTNSDEGASTSPSSTRRLSTPPASRSPSTHQSHDISLSSPLSSASNSPTRGSVTASDMWRAKLNSAQRKSTKSSSKIASPRRKETPPQLPSFHANLQGNEAQDSNGGDKRAAEQKNSRSHLSAAQSNHRNLHHRSSSLVPETSPRMASYYTPSEQLQRQKASARRQLHFESEEEKWWEKQHAEIDLQQQQRRQEAEERKRRHDRRRRSYRQRQLKQRATENERLVQELRQVRDEEESARQWAPDGDLNGHLSRRTRDKWLMRSVSWSERSLREKATTQPPLSPHDTTLRRLFSYRSFTPAPQLATLAVEDLPALQPPITHRFMPEIERSARRAKSGDHGEHSRKHGSHGKPDRSIESSESDWQSPKNYSPRHGGWGSPLLNTSGEAWSQHSSENSSSNSTPRSYFTVQGNGTWRLFPRNGSAMTFPSRQNDTADNSGSGGDDPSTRVKPTEPSDNDSSGHEAKFELEEAKVLASSIDAAVKIGEAQLQHAQERRRRAAETKHERKRNKQQKQGQRSKEVSSESSDPPPSYWSPLAAPAKSDGVSSELPRIVQNRIESFEAMTAASSARSSPSNSLSRQGSPQRPNLTVSQSRPSSNPTVEKARAHEYTTNSASGDQDDISELRKAAEESCEVASPPSASSTAIAMVNRFTTFVKNSARASVAKVAMMQGKSSPTKDDREARQLLAQQLALEERQREWDTKHTKLQEQRDTAFFSAMREKGAQIMERQRLETSTVSTPTHEHTMAETESSNATPILPARRTSPSSSSLLRTESTTEVSTPLSTLRSESEKKVGTIKTRHVLLRSRQTPAASSLPPNSIYQKQHSELHGRASLSTTIPLSNKPASHSSIRETRNMAKNSNARSRSPSPVVVHRPSALSWASSSAAYLATKNSSKNKKVNAVVVSPESVKARPSHPAPVSSISVEGAVFGATAGAMNSLVDPWSMQRTNSSAQRPGTPPRQAFGASGAGVNSTQEFIKKQMKNWKHHTAISNVASIAKKEKIAREKQKDEQEHARPSQRTGDGTVSQADSAVTRVDTALVSSMPSTILRHRLSPREKSEPKAAQPTKMPPGARVGIVYAIMFIILVRWACFEIGQWATDARGNRLATMTDNVHTGTAPQERHHGHRKDSTYFGDPSVQFSSTANAHSEHHYSEAEEIAAQYGFRSDEQGQAEATSVSKQREEIVVDGAGSFSLQDPDKPKWTPEVSDAEYDQRKLERPREKKSKAKRAASDPALTGALLVLILVVVYEGRRTVRQHQEPVDTRESAPTATAPPREAPVTAQWKEAEQDGQDTGGAASQNTPSSMKLKASFSL